jgi:hypothetical protein
MLLSWDFGMADAGCDPFYARWNVRELLGQLPLAWLVATRCEVIKAGAKMIEFCRVRITAAGRRAIEG